MIRYFLTLTLTLFIFSNAVSQRFSMEEWHEGKAMLAGGEVVKGLIHYDLQTNTIQVQAAGSNDVYALSAQKIASFEFIDKLSNVYRQFYSLPYSIMNNNYKVPVLFEAIIQGPLTLLSREHIETRTQSFRGYRTYSRPELVYTFYFVDDNDRIVEYSGRKKDLQPFLTPYQKEVQKYMKENRLKSDNRTDLAKITIYYNQLERNK